MADNEDIGTPIAYTVLPTGTPVWARSGDRVGDVAHVLADDQTDLFLGLIVTGEGGHRFAPADLVDGLYERGVIVAVPWNELPEPADEPAASDGLTGNLKRAWDWLVQPR